MQAHKLIVHVPRSRRIDLTLPDDTPEGEAEVIVLTSTQPQTSSTAASQALLSAFQAIDDWRGQNTERLLSKDDIDAAIEEERRNWGER